MIQSKQLYIYGRQPVLEALRSSQEVVRVFLAENITGKTINTIRGLCQSQDITLQTVQKNELQKFVGAVVHQGVAALIRFQPFLREKQWLSLLTEEPNPVILIADQIQDAHNLGAILRTAEITNVNCIVLPQKGSAPLNATMAKTSAGALFYARFYLATVLEKTLLQLQENNFAVYATLPSANQSIYDANFKNKTAIIIGSENKGIRKSLLHYCTHSIKIPQFGKVSSLNASVSAAFVLYEIIRQRKFSS